MKKLALSLFLVAVVSFFVPYKAKACYFYSPDGCIISMGTPHQLGGCTTQCGGCEVQVIWCDDWE